jgi:hypothetical protein
MQTVNLLANADAYVQEIAYNYGPRSAFAFKQTISEDVVLKSIYNDDADICFYFYIKSIDVYVQVYANNYNNSATGEVYVKNNQVAEQILKQHFNIDTQKTENCGDYVYFVATQ